MKNVCYNIDCMEHMATVPDKFYDLAIVDPPYGRFKGMSRTGGSWAAARSRDKKIDKWDKAPDKKYFQELFRISKNQIIWGGNYFNLPPCRCFIIWDKINIPDSFSMAMCEFAWTSFNENAKIFRHIPQIKNRIHETEKLVILGKWCLKHFARSGDKIIDTHCGSGYLRIACYDLGFWFEGCEIDKDYWKAQEDRFQNHISQPELINKQEIQEIIFSQGEYEFD